MFLYIDPIVKLLDGQGDGINVYTILIRLFVAFLIGFIIGGERSYKHQNAGLRTYILVSLGSTIAMLVNQFVKEGSDVSRIGAGVITGIGFLGAGSIIVTSRNQIRGLTTAATLWVTASLGLATGIGFYTVSLVGLVLVIITLTLLPVIENTIINNSRRIDLYIELRSDEDLKEFVDCLRQNQVEVLQLVKDEAYTAAKMAVYTVHILAPVKYKKYKAEINRMLSFDYINHLEVV